MLGGVCVRVPCRSAATCQVAILFVATLKLPLFV